jgi:hypothetical protein
MVVRDEDLEALLAASRPAPRDEFVDDLERRLLGRATMTRALPRWLSAFKVGAAGAAVAGGVLLVAVLAGANPFGTDSKVEAAPDCHVRLVPTTVRVPVVVADRNGDPRVIYRSRPGTKPIRECEAAPGRPTGP